ncbi:hypothetical protein P879_02643, partial [Paragonimus westermani]
PETQLKLRFLDFRLDDRFPNDCTHEGGDRIEIYHGSHLDAKRPNNVLCGERLNSNQSGEYSVPSDLRFPLHLLTLVFITDAYISGNERGFLLSYTFDSIYALRNPVDSEVNHEQPASLVTHTDRSASELSHKMKSTQNGVCHFTITSNGRELFGRIPLPRYTDILPKAAAKKDNQSKVSCRWELQGDPGQRIQLKLRKKYASVQSHRSLSDHPKPRKFSSIQHDQELQFDGSTQAIPLVSSSSPLRTLRCQTPLSVELVNYKSSSDTVKSGITDINERSIPTGSSQPMNAAFRTSSDPHFHHYDPQPSDPVRICAGEVASQSPAGKGFMSGKFPRLDVVLHLDTPHTYSPKSEDMIIDSGEYIDLGYDIEYKFVTNYGVIAPFGVQRKPGCHFEFHWSHSTKGNFSSPNYPGLYPTELICEYRFSGPDVRKINIEFLEFDVESASKTCSDDRMGDYVEFSSCHSVELLSYPKRRLCHQTSRLNRYRIDWYEPCLLIRFSSNEMFVGHGFFGVYEFHTSGKLKICWFDV